jgi:hypothetical protein
VKSKWLKIAALVFFGALVIVLTLGATCTLPTIPWLTG